MINYLKNGLRRVPLNPRMLYNFAVANERVGNDVFALLFFKFARMARLNWADAWFGESVVYFKLGMFRDAADSIEAANKCYKANCLEDKHVMIYFQAMCYRKLRLYRQAKRDYDNL